VTKLIHAHDPMCSWCWAFRPAWQAVQSGLPADVTVQTLLGGLAPDSDEPMPDSMQQHLQSVWRQIEQHVPGTEFNHDFWKDCQPRRSTWPACRAVLAAEKQRAGAGETMTVAIQQAYYLQARNPSDTETLCTLAEAVNLDKDRFEAALNNDETRAEHQRHMQQCATLGINGYPSLVLIKDSAAHRVNLNHNSADATLDHINQLLR